MPGVQKPQQQSNSEGYAGYRSCKDSSAPKGDRLLRFPRSVTDIEGQVLRGTVAIRDGYPRDSENGQICAA